MRTTSLLALTPLLAIAAACGSGTHNAVLSPQHPGAQRSGQAQQISNAAASKPSTKMCTTHKLSVHLGRSDGAAGSTYAPLVFTNKGKSKCTLFGYPGVSFVAPGSGDQVGAAASRNPQHKSKTVTLAPKHSASAVVQIVDYLNFPSSNCNKATVSGLRVYPPGNTAAAYVKFPTNRSACSSDVNQLSVESVVKGKKGM